MQKRGKLSFYFFIFLILSLILFAASQLQYAKPLSSVFQGIISPFQAITYGVFNKITNFSESPQLKVLKAQNMELTQKLINQQKLAADNKALRDQFQTQNPRSENLVPADVVGAPGFIPGISVPEMLIIDRGENDGLRVGDAVIYQDNLIGKINKTSSYLSNVTLITDTSSSFTAKTLNTQSLGVVKGQGGGEMILDNVVLSDDLKKDDLVITKGNINENGIGFPPNLVVGKILSVSKNASDLFQKADIKSFVDFTKIDKVFVISNLQ